MNTRLALLASVLCAVLASVGVSIGAGLFANLPIVGSPSYCAGTNTGPLGPVCTVTVPAGPPALTGAEVFPADTGVQTSGAAGSALVTTAQLGGGAKSIYTTAATPTTVPNHVVYEILDTGVPATLVLNLPATTFDGEIVRVNCAAAVGTSLTIQVTAGTGQTIKNGPAPGACSAGTTYGLLYNASNTTWYRVQ